MHVSIHEGRGDQRAAQFEYFLSIAEAGPAGTVVSHPGNRPVCDG
jgi:hypothetical protein